MQVKLILHIETKNVVKDVAKEISDRQRIILELLQDSPTLSATELSQKTGMTSRTIQRDLADLQEKGILSREGGRKEGRWIMLKKIN
ncbi:HTH domain-containing protein [Xylanibacter oryzae]|uniref:HTH domain-containing protein n=1 Tax=Xylanibacter oryzae TaxID=185293 RepID=UPI0004B0ED37|nr:HTH domain-containing protein [Xylanibacter oryzae]